MLNGILGQEGQGLCPELPLEAEIADTPGGSRAPRQVFEFRGMREAAAGRAAQSRWRN
jgi:hypothetical protein